jgi:hypothetical protein
VVNHSQRNTEAEGKVSMKKEGDSTWTPTLAGVDRVAEGLELALD